MFSKCYAMTQEYNGLPKLHEKLILWSLEKFCFKTIFIPNFYFPKTVTLIKVAYYSHSHDNTKLENPTSNFVNVVAISFIHATVCWIYLKTPSSKVIKTAGISKLLILYFVTVYHYVIDAWQHSKEKPKCISICRCNNTSHYNELHLIFCPYASITWNSTWMATILLCNTYIL